MSDTPRTDEIFGRKAYEERRVGHGAEKLCRELEREIAALRAFAERIAKQKPQKPDHWTECSQCGRNASDADDLISPS